MKRLIRNLIVGDRNYFGSWTEYRQVILSGQYGLIAITGLLIYGTLDLVNGFYAHIPVYGFGILIIYSTIGLHRKGQHCLANTILYPSLIAIIYLITSSESLANGGFALYIPVTIGAFASFDYKHRKLALMIAGFACLMFLATYLNFGFLPWRAYTHEQEMVNMLINFSVAMPSSLLSIYMLLRLSHRNSSKLLESNRLLQKSNDELDRFIYSTSHDLRAPLASILGLIELSGKPSQKQDLEIYLGLMKGRVHALEYFIKEIIDYSQNGKTELKVVSFDLHKLTEEVWNSLKFSQAATDILFEITFEPDFIIVSDVARLKVILSNLISNAIRYHDSSKLEKFIRVNCKRTEKSFILSVEDNGQGIAPEYHSQVFQMFFRANETSSGSGLGLYIVQETIAKLSGQMRLESAPKVGSTFTLKIPK